MLMLLRLRGSLRRRSAATEALRAAPAEFAAALASCRCCRATRCSADETLRGDCSRCALRRRSRAAAVPRHSMLCRRDAARRLLPLRSAAALSACRARHSCRRRDAARQLLPLRSPPCRATRCSADETLRGGCSRSALRRRSRLAVPWDTADKGHGHGRDGHDAHGHGHGRAEARARGCSLSCLGSSRSSRRRKKKHQHQHQHRNTSSNSSNLGTCGAGSSSLGTATALAPAEQEQQRLF
jgi:hypothetical protein